MIRFRNYSGDGDIASLCNRICQLTNALIVLLCSVRENFVKCCYDYEENRFYIPKDLHLHLFVLYVYSLS